MSKNIQKWVDAPQSLRATRYEARELLRAITTRDRLGGCGLTVIREGGVQVRLSSDGRAGFAGVATCGSVFACPVCSAKVLGRRSVEVQEAIQRWLSLDESNAVAMWTLTAQHSKFDSLDVLWSGMTEAFRKLSGDKTFLANRRAIGWRFQIRATEVRLGENGWHPHFHVLLFMDRQATDVELQEFASDGAKRWDRAVQASGLKGASAQAQQLQVFQGSQETIVKAAGEYTTKAVYGQGFDQDASRLALEITRGDLKQSRAGSVTPFQLLEGILELLKDSGGDMDEVDLQLRRWREFERVSKGKHSHYWGRGLRAFLGMCDQEKTDEEIAAEEVGTAEDAILDIPSAYYRRLCKASPTAALGLLLRVEEVFQLGGRSAAVLAAEGYLSVLRIQFGPPTFNRSRSRFR